MKSKTKAGSNAIEIVILAGGLSRRMGRDKSRLLLDGRTMLARIRATAGTMDLPVRVIRKDKVPRCGPLGGIVTALTTTKAESVLFLACDMPLLSEALLRRVLRSASGTPRAIFTAQGGRIGFPFLLPRPVLPKVEARIARRTFALHDLAAGLDAKLLPLSPHRRELMNVNTPADQAEAERLLKTRRSKTKKPEASLVTSAVTPYGARP